MRGYRDQHKLRLRELFLLKVVEIDHLRVFNTDGVGLLVENSGESLSVARLASKVYSHRGEVAWCDELLQRGVPVLAGLLFLRSDLFL